MDTVEMRKIAPLLDGPNAIWLIAYCSAVEAGVGVTRETADWAEKLVEHVCDLTFLA